LEHTNNGCPHFDEDAYASEKTYEDLSYHLKGATYRLHNDGSIIRVFAANPDQPDLLVCEHLWPFERKMFVCSTKAVLDNSKESTREYAQCAMTRPRAEAEAQVLRNREQLKEAAYPGDTQTSGLQFFKGEEAVKKFDELWTQASHDQDNLEKQNPDLDEEAAGTFVLHYPLEEACPSSRSGMSAAGVYDENEIFFATMVVLVSKARNWMYFFDTRQRTGVLVQVRTDALVPGLGKAPDMYQLYQDPGHGWLRVPLQELIGLDILGEISDFSPMHGEFRYLEGDCDMEVFMRAKKALDEPVLYTVVEVDDFDRDILGKPRNR
jgi:hypothetical protein